MFVRSSVFFWFFEPLNAAKSHGFPPVSSGFRIALQKITIRFVSKKKNQFYIPKICSSRAYFYRITNLLYYQQK